jgi:predicted RNase H-like HicB family nuclease
MRSGGRGAASRKMLCIFLTGTTLWVVPCHPQSSRPGSSHSAPRAPRDNYQKTCMIRVIKGMIMKYTVVLEPQEEGGFTVQCVEIPGAISQGETREEALANIKEAIELVLDVQREKLYRKTSTARREISKVDVVDVI